MIELAKKMLGTYVFNISIATNLNSTATQVALKWTMESSTTKPI